MSWSWRIGRIAGIDVYVHFTFLLLLGWLAIVHYTARGDWGDAMSGVGFMLALFGIVVLHELGHALAARRFGIQTRDITLLPIGGVARLERIPEHPWQELIVALAGPAVNIVLAASIYLGLSFDRGLFEVSEAARVGGQFLAQLFWVNVTLAVFNLLPAFPMDGGRAVRALLAMRMDYVRATQIAASLGQGMAILFLIWGLFGNPFLMFIALFVWLGAAQEASMVQIRAALSGIPVEGAMVTKFHTLRPDDPVARAAELFREGFQQDFPVVADNGSLVGVVTRTDLAAALAANQTMVKVREVMHTDFKTTSPREMLHTAFDHLQESDCHTLPVVNDSGRLVGLLTADNVADVLMIQASRRGAQHQRPMTTPAGREFAPAP